MVSRDSDRIASTLLFGTGAGPMGIGCGGSLAGIAAFLSSMTYVSHESVDQTEFVVPFIAASLPACRATVRFRCGCTRWERETCCGSFSVSPC